MDEFQDDRPEKKDKDYTLVFCRRNHEDSSQPRQILLGMKKRGFGAGKWNGFGGKVEQGETYEVAAKRELLEESSLHAVSLTRLGYLFFDMEHFNLIMRVHVYDCWEFEGEPMESEEMKPQWYSEEEIPFDRMWPDDSFWFEYMKARTPFFGSFTFEDDETITESTVRLA